MITLVENAFSEFVTTTGISSLYERWRGNRSMIIIYHRIVSDSDRALDVPGVSLSDFGSQMKYLAAHFQCLTVRELAEYLRRGLPLPTRSVAITFDDGYLDNYSLAFPVLRANGLSATFFVCPGMIDERQSYWWDRLEHALATANVKEFQFRGHQFRLHSNKEVQSARQRLNNYILEREPEKEEILPELQAVLGSEIPEAPVSALMDWGHLKAMQDCGMEIGGHTLYHVSLGRAAFENGSAEREISACTRRLEQELGATISTFAYPYGNERHIDPRAFGLLRKNGYKVAVSGIVGVAGPAENLYCLPRIAIQPHDNSSVFMSKVSGLYAGIYRRTRVLVGKTHGSPDYREIRRVQAA